MKPPFGRCKEQRPFLSILDTPCQNLRIILVASATSDFLDLDPHISSPPPFDGILVEISTLTTSFAISTSYTCRQTGRISGVALVVTTPSRGIPSGLPRKLHPLLTGPQNRTDRCLRICHLISFLTTLPSGRPQRPRSGQRDPPPRRRCRRFSSARPPPPPPIRPSTSLLSSAESTTPVPESGLTPPATSPHPPYQPRSEEAQDVPEQRGEGGDGWGEGRRGGCSTCFDAVRRLATRGSEPPTPPPLSWRTWRNRRRRRVSPCRRLPVAIGPPHDLPGCPPGPLRETCLPPPPRSSAPHPPRPPTASTLSSPTLPINSSSSPTSPPSIASPSSSASGSASASASASDLPQPTPPPSRRRSTYRRGRQAQTMVPVTRRGGSKGGGRWPPPRPRAYEPSTYRRVKKLRVLIKNKNLRKSLARRNGNEILIWSWNNPNDLVTETHRGKNILIQCQGLVGMK